jgi:carboxyl-terminal processing protease
MKRLKKRSFTWLLIISLCLGSAGFISFDYTDEFKVIKNLDIFYNLFRELNLYYVDETNPEELIKNGINGMLSELDPYTSYIPPEKEKDFQFQTTGDYGGIGSLIRSAGSYAIISQPYKGFPADKANLMPGDTIIKINDKSIEGKSLEEISNLLKGIPGTNVDVTIHRPYTDTVMTKKLTREEVHIPAVPYYGIIDNNIGYIHLQRFTRDATEEVEKALKELTNDKGAEKILLDLRNNPGGLLDEAISIAGLFVEKGSVIVKTKGSIEKFNQTYETENNPVNTEIPLAILVNNNSASASEIIAGAIQDYDRGVIVGEKTFGKGLVQSTRPLSYGAQLKVTTAKYYIPSGRCIQARNYNGDSSEDIADSLSKKFTTENGRVVYDRKGIMPDIKIEAETLSKIAASLYAKNFIFDFTNFYTATNDSIRSITGFNVSDSLYSDFITFLEGKDFDYQTRSEDQLNDLIEIAKAEKYYEKAEELFDSLKDKLAHDKQKDLRTFSDEIRQLLKEEIISRYYYTAGKLQATIKEDKQVNEAIGILKDMNKYNNILTVSSDNSFKNNNN